MFIRTFIVSIFAISLLVSPVWSAMGEHAKWASDLGLTQEQKSNLLKIHKEMREIRLKQRENVASLRLKIKNELNQPNPSKPILDGYAVDLGKLHTMQIQNNTEQMLKIKAILTPEQFSKLIDKKWDGRGMSGHRQIKGMHGNGAGAGHFDNSEDPENVK
jgi:Spy/CpxP family protein refolding chaperone